MSSGAAARWVDAVVVAVSDVATGVRRIELGGPPAGRAAPGSHVDVRVHTPAGEDVRSYSVVESGGADGRVVVSVLHTRTSRGGSRFMHALRPGDGVRVTQPLQNFPLSVGSARHVLLAGGIGITALVEAARVLRLLGADYRFVYVGRTRDRMAYLAELEALHGDRMRVHVDDEGSPLDVDALVGDIADEDLGRRTELSMCGPIRLMEAVRRSWSDRELPSYNLRFETFGSSGWFEAEDFVVRVPELGIETRVGADSTLLDALITAGADVMFDCRKGECGLCVLAVTEVQGTIDHRDVFLSTAQRERGDRICACVSRVAGVGGEGVLVLGPP